MSNDREQRKWRKRRIIYNNDGNDAAVQGATTPEAFHAARNDHMLGTNIDSVFYCTGAATMFTHLTPTGLGETYGEYITDESHEWNTIVRDNLTALSEQGHDVLNLVSAFCREHGYELFFSHRINDIHDSVPAWTPEMSRWKRENPHYMMGKIGDWEKFEDADPRKFFTALDFEIPQVLDYLFAILEDVCTRYDLDGIEIDYFRSPFFFRPNLEFKPATPAQCDVLTAFQRRVRAMVGDKLLAIRPPMTIEKCLHVGIDIERWLEEDLLDIMIGGGGYIPFTQPNRAFVDLAHRYNKPAYPAINASGMRAGDYSKIGLDTPMGWRGAAANIWHSGADGVYTFNIFPETDAAPAMAGSVWWPTADEDPRFNDLASPDLLAGLDKTFSIDRWRCDEGDLAQGIEQDQVLPKTIDGELTLTLPVGEDVSAAALTLRIELSAQAQVQITINGHDVEPSEVDKTMITLHPAAHVFTIGDNTITLRSPQAVDVVRLELDVKYP